MNKLTGTKHRHGSTLQNITRGKQRRCTTLSSIHGSIHGGATCDVSSTVGYSIRLPTHCACTVYHARLPRSTPTFVLPALLRWGRRPKCGLGTRCFAYCEADDNSQYAPNQCLSHSFAYRRYCPSQASRWESKASFHMLIICKAKHHDQSCRTNTSPATAKTCWHSSISYLLECRSRKSACTRRMK